MIDIHQYIQNILRENRLAIDHRFHPGTCTGIEGIEDIINHWRSRQAFVLTDDIVTGETFRRGGAWYQRQTYTIFILHRHTYGNETQRHQALTLCRTLQRQLMSRIIADAHRWQDTMAIVDLERMPTTDIGFYAAAGCTGCYFMLNIDTPTNLTLDPDEWL